LYGQCRAGTQINFPESWRGLGHVTPTIFGSTVGYPSDSLASCNTVCTFIVLVAALFFSGQYIYHILNPVNKFILQK